MDELPRNVDEKLGPRLAQIVAVIDRFTEAHLDEEYKQLCREMAAVLCREGYPITSGKAAGWAAGVVYSIAWVNFLGDPSQPHHMKAEGIAQAVGVSPATLMNRARLIREGLGLRRMDLRWCTKEMFGHNPLAWMVSVDGLPYDIRSAPRQIQEQAYRRGLILFVPGEAANEDSEP